MIWRGQRKQNTDSVVMAENITNGYKTSDNANLTWIGEFERSFELGDERKFVNQLSI